MIGTDGGTLEITHANARVVVPAGLPTGVGRRMTLSEASDRPRSADIAEGFARIGAALRFDAAINATSNPVVVSIRQPRDPSRANLRLVLAVEQPAMCVEGMSPLPGGSGLCSTWELIDAHYDAGERRLVAEVRTPGGYRLVFGTVPVPPPADAE